MTKTQAFRAAKQIWPECQPTRLSYSTVTFTDGDSQTDGCVLLACHDKPITLALYSLTDLVRVRATIDNAIATRRILRPKRKR